jgi:hypothetical protein
MVSTPDIGAATTTGKWSNESLDRLISTGVRGGVSVCWVDDEPENRMDVSSQFDLREGPVLDRVRAYDFGVAGVLRSSVESKLGNT